MKTHTHTWFYGGRTVDLYESNGKFYPINQCDGQIVVTVKEVGYDSSGYEESQAWIDNKPKGIVQSVEKKQLSVLEQLCQRNSSSMTQSDSLENSPEPSITTEVNDTTDTNTSTISTKSTEPSLPMVPPTETYSQSPISTTF